MKIESLQHVLSMRVAKEYQDVTNTMSRKSTQRFVWRRPNPYLAIYDEISTPKFSLGRAGKGMTVSTNTVVDA
jgi:hypothetical protein